MNELIRGGLSVTKQQAQVIDQLLNNKISVVGAGAGSGKTHTTVAAVLEILERKLATLDQFILITFTNKAADELRERVEKELIKILTTVQDAQKRKYWREQQERLSSAFIGTIHSFCAQVLRTFGYEQRVARESKITLSRYQFTEAIQDVVEKYAASQNPILLGEGLYWQEHDLRRLLTKILDYMQNHNIQAAEILKLTEHQPQEPGKAYRVAIAKLLKNTQQVYVQKKQKEQVLDSTDLLSKTAELLQGSEGSIIVNKLTQRYRYLFIDDFLHVTNCMPNIPLPNNHPLFRVVYGKPSFPKHPTRRMMMMMTMTKMLLLRNHHPTRTIMMIHQKK